MVTAQQVFNITMSLADELSDSGFIDPTNTASYRVRTPGILTDIINEFALSGTSNAVSQVVTALTDNLSIDDTAALSILPYALGAELFKEENEDIYIHFRQRYNELKSIARRKRPASFVKIDNVYGW